MAANSKAAALYRTMLGPQQEGSRKAKRSYSQAPIHASQARKLLPYISKQQLTGTYFGLHTETCSAVLT
jgi:hypothetical protein